jgi:inorganic pyrophosphatase
MPNNKKASSSHAGTHRPPRVEVVIETPKGSRNKLKFDPATHQFKLSKVLPEGMMFPHNFGFVPSTKADDGDPLDVLVLTDEPLFPGCLVECNLIGVIKAEQEQEGKKNRNDRLIAVAEQSLLYGKVASFADLNPAIVEQIGAFFVNYQKLRDITVKILGLGDSGDALALVRSSSHKTKAA